MGKYFRTIYLCVVSFVTLVMLVVGSITAVGSLTRYCYPVINTYYYNYDYKSDDTVLVNKFKIYEEYKEEIASRETVARRASIKELFTSIAVVLCGAPLYVIHERQLRKESEEGV